MSAKMPILKLLMGGVANTAYAEALPWTKMGSEQVTGLGTFLSPLRVILVVRFSAQPHAEVKTAALVLQHFLYPILIQPKFQIF